MATQRKLRDFGLQVGTMKSGPLGLITDVPGVLVGHETIDTKEHKTGVTVVLPGGDNPFSLKYTAAAYVLNGFGKTMGLMQVEELGFLETPIALTNTLNIGLVQDGMIDYILNRCEKEGIFPQSINALVGECNDGELNHIQKRAVTQSHVLSAIQKASASFLQGDIGAGKGTLCYGWKGGIGSASRMIPIGDNTYTLGVLVQSNYGSAKDFLLQGKNLIPPNYVKTPERGSIMMVLATDLPVSHRQLKRIIKRMSVAMARLGSYIGHGSGEVMIGFTTANRIPHNSSQTTLPFIALREGLLDLPFRAAGECCEEAILNSMLCADTLIGHNGRVAHSLGAYLEKNPL